MATSGTAAFDLDFTDIAEEAWERAGRELRSGYDLRTARRSMNLMTIEWQNRGINMWTIQQQSFTLVQGLNTYPIPLDTIDLMDHVIRTNANQTSNQADLNITRISMPTYATIPNKLTQARPIQVLVQRNSGETNQLYASPMPASQTQPVPVYLVTSIGTTDTSITLTSTYDMAAQGYIQLGSTTGEIIFYSYISGNTLGNCFRGQNNTTATAYTGGGTTTTVYIPQIPAITVWPTPDGSTTYTFVYWRMRRVQDSGTGVNTADVNFRFLPAVAAGLAYHIAMKVPELMPRIQMLKEAYDEQYNLAAGEDREKAALRLVPRQMFIGGSTP
jgi:hypothetical protein